MLALLCTLTSQPSSGVLGLVGLLQFANPGWQKLTHELPLQDREVTCVVSHTRSQAPQLSGSLWMTRSHPSASFGLQLPYPGLHVSGAQAPEPLH